MITIINAKGVVDCGFVVRKPLTGSGDPILLIFEDAPTILEKPSLAQPEEDDYPYARVKHLVGAVDSGIPDLGSNHRKHLAEIFDKKREEGRY